MRHRHFSNQEVANILYEMAVLYEMQGVQFKSRAYDRAAHGVESFGENVHDLFIEHGTKAVDAIPGVGTGIAEHLGELFATGHFREYEKLKKKVPVDIVGLTSIQGIGPQTVQTLWRKLHIRNVEDLEKAARAGKISTIPHFRKRTEEKILKSIEFQRASGKRFILGFVATDVEYLRRMIARMPEVNRIEVAGSFRRRKETIGDIDILVTSEKPERVQLGLPCIEPELREMTGELEAAKKGALPRLVEYEDLRGDLQVQTNWTDGSATIEKMADAAEAAGLEYIAITDHTRSLAMARGLDEKRLLEQMKEIKRINSKRKAAGKKLLILAGAEVNIQEDGSLDVDDTALEKLDVVGAAIHSFLSYLGSSKRSDSFARSRIRRSTSFFIPRADSLMRGRKSSSISTRSSRRQNALAPFSR